MPSTSKASAGSASAGSAFTSMSINAGEKGSAANHGKLSESNVKKEPIEPNPIRASTQKAVRDKNSSKPSIPPKPKPSAKPSSLSKRKLPKSDSYLFKALSSSESEGSDRVLRKRYKQ